MLTSHPQRRWRRILRGPLTTLVVITALGACGSSERRSPTAAPKATAAPGTTASSVAAPGCQPERRERLDPSSVQHVLPGAPAPNYQTNPPTSGPHQLGRYATGRLTTPIPKPIQVGMLEGGAVLVQYRDLSAQERAELDSLARAQLTVAPNPDLPERIVATAWTYKLVCSRVDLAALREFALRHEGVGASQGH